MGQQRISVPDCGQLLFFDNIYNRETGAVPFQMTIYAGKMTIYAGMNVQLPTGFEYPLRSHSFEGH